MLRPVTHAIEIGPDVYRQIVPRVLEPVFKKRGKRKRITITMAKELLAAAVPQYQQTIRDTISQARTPAGLPPRELGVLLHEALSTVTTHLRRAGAKKFRAAQNERNDENRERLLWNEAFSHLHRWIESGGLLQRPEQLESLDIIVECVRLWVADLAHRVGLFTTTVEPSAFFLDTEREVEGKITCNGQHLYLRGRPDAIFLDRACERPEIVEYKFGGRGQLELQIAQTVLYISLVNAIKGPGIESGRLLLFGLEEERIPESMAVRAAEVVVSTEQWPHQIEAAFSGYVGNQAAVRRLKRSCAAALMKEDFRTGLNIMLCGPAGLGKTELARRTAKALELPFVDVPGHRIGSVDDVLELAENELRTKGMKLERTGTDSGLSRYRFPSCLVFIDEVHLLKKKSDLFLNMFEPRDRRAVAKKRVADLEKVTFLAATTDRGLLPSALLSRFRIVELEPYTADEVAEILAPLFKNQDVATSFLRTLAQIGRLNPRRALDLGREILEPDPRGIVKSVAGLLQRAREDWHVDEKGLDNTDRKYLRSLMAGPRGLTALSSLLQLKTEEIRTRVEPYLLQLELVRATSRGREITELGRNALNPQ